MKVMIFVLIAGLLVVIAYLVNETGTKRLEKALVESGLAEGPEAKRLFRMSSFVQVILFLVLVVLAVLLGVEGYYSSFLELF